MTAYLEMDMMEAQAMMPPAVQIIMPKKMSEKEFFEFCIANPDLRIERERDGNITVMSPAGLISSFQEGEVYAELRNWNRKHKLGKCFNASGGFTLPDTSVKAPDAAFVSKEKWKQLPVFERSRFAHVVPDFVAEVRSNTDSLKKLQAKMTDTWLANGVRLAWLIDPIKQKSYIFRQSGTEEVVEGFDKKPSGEDVLPGFEFDLSLLLED